MNGDLKLEDFNPALIGRKVIYFPSVTSTIDIAQQEAKNGAREGLVIIAGKQTAGRGRRNRVWLSPEGCLAISILLRPALSRLPQLIMITSLAVVRTIKEVSGLNTQIKWPNDILLDGKKVCGILVENEIKGDTVNYSIVSTGINLNCDLSTLAGTGQEVTSLSFEIGHDIPVGLFVRDLLTQMDELYFSPHEIFESWRTNLMTLGKKVRVSSDKAIDEGVAESVSEDGTLWLRRTDGNLVAVMVGDVTLRNI